MNRTFVAMLIFLLLAASPVIATSISVAGEPLSKSGLYVGDTWWTSVTVRNDNSFCKISCSLSVGGNSGVLNPGDAWQTSIGVTVDAHKPSPQYDTVTINCQDVSTSWPCGGSKSKDITFTSYYGYCGEGVRNGNEECDGSDVGGTCSSKGYDGGVLQCTSNCKLDTLSCYKCGDGKKDGSEQCDGSDFGGKTCGSFSYSGGSLSCSSSCQISTNNCYKCGDGKKNPGEECDGSDFGGATCESRGFDYGQVSCSSSCSILTSACKTCSHECSRGAKTCSGDGYKTCEADNNGCRKWSGVGSCGVDKACSNGDCISINTNEDCGAIGNRCNIEKREGAIKKQVCSSVTTANDIIEVAYEKCINKQCAVQKEEKTVPHNCISPNPYCQDGTCGCSEGYNVCEPLKSCVKRNSVELNQPCKCDFQCKEGFCDETSGQCVKGLNIKISSSKSVLSVGDEITVSLSVANPLDTDVNADITLSLGNGVELVEVLSGDQCAGSQCKLDKTDIPAGGKKDVTVRLKANSDTTSLMSAFVNYQLGSKKIDLKDETSIIITECGNGKVEQGETSAICCVDAGCPAGDRFYSFTCNDKTRGCDKSLHSYYISGGIGAVVLIILMLFIITKLVNYSRKSRHEMGMKNQEKAEEEKQREKIRTLLNRIRKTINVDKPLSIDTVKSKLKNLGVKSVNDDILSDEYNDFLDELEEQKKEEQKKEAEHEKKEEDEKKQKVSEQEKKEEKEPKKMHCHKCGAEARGRGKFCHKCGTLLKR